MMMRYVFKVRSLKLTKYNLHVECYISSNLQEFISYFYFCCKISFDALQMVYILLECKGGLIYLLWKGYFVNLEKRLKRERLSLA